MQKEKMTRLMTVPHSDQTKPLEIDSPETPKWKQDVNQIVADLTVYRIKHRISQAELARRINTTQSVIARFERMGRIPTIEFLYKVAEGLGIEFDPVRIKASKPEFEPSYSWVLREVIQSQYAEPVAYKSEWTIQLPQSSSDLRGSSIQNPSIDRYVDRLRGQRSEKGYKHVITSCNTSIIVTEQQPTKSNLDEMANNCDQKTPKAA